MPRFRRFQALPLAILTVLGACDNGNGNGDMGGPPPPEPQRGDLIGDVSRVASYSPAELLAVISSGTVTRDILDDILSPDCRIDVFHFEYRTVDPAGELTPASGALMVPHDAGSGCQGARPVVLYAHGTNPDKSYDLADLESSNNTEAVLIAALFAAEGYIVVAPNYVGYDTSTLGYHPYLNGEQQSGDMVDALTAARSALPVADAPDTSDNGQLFVTGYSQGGYVAMATHRALQDAGETVTASAPMSGPYALSAFADAIFQGQVTSSAPLNLTLILTSYQNAYGNIYASETDAYAGQYAADIETLLPSTTPLGDLVDQGKLPANAIFSSSPPDPAYAGMTPATTPANLAPVFARGFGTDHLLTNEFRLAYLQDADAHPDGGFPVLSDGLPPVDPENPFRQALKINDQRAWTPTSPMLLCAGDADPTVLYLNTELMQSFWASTNTVSVLDVASAVTSGDPYADQKNGFSAAKNLVELVGGDDDVRAAYHAGLVAPFCLSAARQFFGGF